MPAWRNWFGRLARRASRPARAAARVFVGNTIVVLLKAFKRTDPDGLSAFNARVARRIGPWFPEHRTGRANLAAAYPDKTPAEIEHILAGLYDNLGRIGSEYVHLGHLLRGEPGASPDERIEIPPSSTARFYRLRDDGKPALLFAAHLANWELPAVVAAANGLDTAIVYRAPNIGNVAEAIAGIRAVNMGTLIPTAGLDAAFKVAAALERGAHVGMLVDQHFSRGVDVTFFGRRCKANPLLARLARQFDCPIHGARTIRLPDNRFRVELTEAIEPARDARGNIDVQGTMQIVTTVVEGWVREHPEQWLWLHRRWR